MLNQHTSIHTIPIAGQSDASDIASETKCLYNGAQRATTKLGEYLASKSVNKAIVARKTGLSKQRLGELTLNSDTKLRAHEVYLIGMAIGVNPSELFEYVCNGLKLRE